MGEISAKSSTVLSAEEMRLRLITKSVQNENSEILWAAYKSGALSVSERDIGLGCILYHQGHIHQATEMLESIDKNKVTPSVRTLLISGLTNCYVELQDNAKLELLLAGTKQPLAVALARVNFKRGEYDAAAEKLAPHVRKKPPFHLSKPALAMFIVCKDGGNQSLPKDKQLKNLIQKHSYQDLFFTAGGFFKEKTGYYASTGAYDRGRSSGPTRMYFAPMVN